MLGDLLEKFGDFVPISVTSRSIQGLEVAMAFIERSDLHFQSVSRSCCAVVLKERRLVVLTAVIVAESSTTPEYLVTVQIDAQ